MKNEIVKMKDRINQNAINEKLLLEENHDWYLEIQSLYSKALACFLLSNIPLQEYDKKISNSNLDFQTMPMERRNPYQKSSTLGLEFIYVRNFLFIEKLSKEEIDYFKNKIRNNQLEIDEEMLKIVKNTYLEVISDNYRDGKYEDVFSTCYGAMIPRNIVRGKCLVLVIHYGKNRNIINGPEFIQNLKDKKEFLRNLVLEMKKEIYKKLRIKVEILVKDYVEI